MNKLVLRNGTSLPSMALLLLMLAVPASAHAAADATQPATVANDDSATRDIIVTARRREETAQTVPVSITVVDSATIAKQGFQSTNDLQRLVPGVLLNGAGSYSNTTYTIRGQGKAVSGPGLPSVITYVNEVPLPSIGSYAPTFDLSNVQVLKGPQGTLFGRNTTGGAVLVYSAAPTDRLEGYLQGEVGNLSKTNIQGAINIPIIDNVLAVRLAGNFDRREGYTRNLSYGDKLDNTHVDAFRISVLFNPTADISNTFIYDRMLSTTNGQGFYPFQTVNPGLNPAVAELQSHGDRTVRTALKPYDREIFSGITNTTTIDLGSVRFKNIFGYRYTDVHDSFDLTGIANAPLPDLGPGVLALGYVPGQPGTLITSDNQSVTRQYSDEIQISGTAFNKTLSWLVGGFFLDEGPAGRDYLILDLFHPTPPSATTQFVVTNFTGGIWPISSLTDTLYGDKSKALFANVSYKFDDIVPALTGLTLNAGFRYTWDEESVCSNGRTSIALATGQSVIPPYESEADCKAAIVATAYGPASFARSAKFEAPTWTLGLDYKASENLFFYATTRRGYRAGGINSPTLAPILAPFQTYKPQKVTDYEIGSHAKWRSGSWSGRFNIAAFLSNFSDVQLTAAGITAGSGLPGVNASNAPSNTTLEINAGSSRTKGVEADAVVSPMPGLSLSGAVSYLEEHFVRIQPPGILAPFFQANEGFTGAPKWSYQAALDYSLPVGADRGSLEFHAAYYHIDQYFQGPVLLPGYGVGNFSIAWSKMFGQPLALTAYVDNAFDKKYIQDVILSTPSFGVYTGNYAPPRTYGVRLRYDF